MSRARVNEIDLLRFSAAMAVVFFHYAFRGYAANGLSAMPYPLLAPVARYGYLGVHLFFMISGFVILMTASGGNVRGFVVSRLVRLYPAFWASCTITFALTLAIGGARFQASLWQYFVNMTMLSEFFGVPAMDGAYWSLFVEMRFYALVGVVLLVGRIHQVAAVLFFWLAASAALEAWPSYRLSYILVSDYSAYFIAGATCFLIWSRGVCVAKMGMIALSWALALFQSINGLPGFERHYNTRMNRYAVAAIITAFFAAMLLVAFRRTGLLGRSRWPLAGALTYPLYLLHQNIGFMVFNAGYPALNPHLLLWSTLMVVLGLAYAVHVYVEKKFSLSLRKSLSGFLAP